MIGLNKIGLNQVQLNRLRLNAPFPTCRKMAGGGGSSDGFPQLPGDVTRWHFGGLTNEMMAAMDDPRIEDADGKGRFLSFKNFAWGGMSGSNGYTQNFNQYAGLSGFDKTVNDSSIKVFIPQDNNSTSFYDSKSREIGYTYNFYIKVTGIENRELRVINGTEGGTTLSIKQDGVYLINAIVADDWGQNRLYFSFPKAYSNNTIIIEQLPLYPGALVFDGVDDYGTCDNFPILTKEKGYTVVALRSIIDKNIPGYLLSNSAGSNQGAFIFEMTIDSLTASFGKSSPITVNYNNPLTYQTTSKYNQKSISVGELLEGGKSLVVGRNSKEGNLYANAAIWELVFLDHDATEEELTKIKDYFVKTYPWLFPDQAWTVVGKTNEDEDRATIANITGNGNDLVLSNLGFAEGSGYGLYQQNFNTWVKPASRIDVTVIGSSVFKINAIRQSRIIQLYYQSGGSQQPFTIPAFVIKVSGLIDNQKLRYQHHKDGVTAYFEINVDGIYNLPSFEFLAGGSVYGFIFDKIQDSCDITIEQIPEYEGYLVTDGVDDKIASSAFEMGEDFTVVGEWKLLPVSSYNYAGIVKSNNLYVYNNASIGLTVFIRSGGSVTNKVEGIKSLKAICSDGRVYGEDWTEYKLNLGTTVGLNTALNLGFNGSNFTQMAFKNLGIYNNQILSKDNCIKAYNYLQTLKAK